MAALSDFGKRKRQDSSDGRAPVALAKASAMGTTYVDESSEFSGHLRLTQSVCIDGRIEGEIECSDTVTVGPSAHVRANVRAECVVIEGEVQGDIVARGEITLHKTACVIGDMTTAGIVIEKGARVEGRIVIGSEKSNGPVAAANSSGNGSRAEKLGS